MWTAATRACPASCGTFTCLRARIKLSCEIPVATPSTRRQSTFYLARPLKSAASNQLQDSQLQRAACDAQGRTPRIICELLFFFAQICGLRGGGLAFSLMTDPGATITPAGRKEVTCKTGKENGR